MQNFKVQIRHCLLYEYKLDHNASEAGRNICRDKGVMFWELLPENTTLNAIKYPAQLEKNLSLKSLNKACLVAKYIFSITTQNHMFPKLAEKNSRV